MNENVRTSLTSPMQVNTTESTSTNHFSGWSFTQGFVLGQLWIIILIACFIKFFIFGDAPSPDSSIINRHRRAQSFATSRPTSIIGTEANGVHTKKISSVIRPSPPLTTSAILAKTYYNVNGHQPESLDWFNVLIAQTIAQLRVDAQQDNAILSSLTSAMNTPQKPDFVDEIRVTEINLGDEFPIFSNCRVIPVVDSENIESGRLQARMDVDLSDTITLGIETKLLLNYPKPFVAVLPVALAVSVVRFSGTLSISFIPSPAPPYSSSPPSPSSSRKESSTTPAPADPTPPTTLTFSFLPDYRLELSTHSLLGSRSRLQDVPKIGQLIDARLHAWFDERCVEPRFQQVVLPSLWPRRRNTRGGDAEIESEDRDNMDSPSAKTSPRAKQEAERRNQASTSKPPPSLQPLVTSMREETVEVPDPTSFTSGRELEKRLRRPAGALGLHERARSYRMPGSMPL